MKKKHQNKAAPNSRKPFSPFFNKMGEQAFFGPSSDFTPPFFQVQTKLNIGRPDDQYEIEADRIAEQVVNAPTSNGIAPPIQPKQDPQENEESLNRKESESNELLQPKPLAAQVTPLIQRAKESEEELQAKPIIQKQEEEEEEALQMKSIEALPVQAKESSTSTISSKLSQSKGSGSELPKATNKQMSTAFGVDFSKVKIHTDANSVQMNQSLGARAFTNRNNVYFNKGEYNPHSNEGKHLLAHELTHVVQQEKGNLDKVQRWQISETDNTPRPSPPSATMRVSLSGLKFHFNTAYYFSEGATRPQLMASLLNILLDSQYHPGLEDEVIASLGDASLNWYGTFSASAEAEAGQVFQGTINLDAEFSYLLVTTLESARFNLRTILDDNQRELISLGNSSNDIFRLIQSSDNPLPEWYTEWIFARVMSNNADMLRLYHSSRLLMDDGTSISGREGLVDSIRAYAAETADILETIRVDYDLGNHEPDSGNSIDISLAYRRIFQIGEAASILGLEAAPSEVRPDNALNFMRFLRTQPALLLAAQNRENRSARMTLLERFERFYARSSQLGALADEMLSDDAATATDEAWSAELTSSPTIQEPLFEASTSASYRFTMAMQMGHWLDHFALYSYQWERARIENPPSETDQDIEILGLPDTPNHSEVRDLQRSRVRRYNEADMERVIDSMGTRPSASAVLLVAANNILRTFAAEMRSEVERVTEARNEKVIAFPEPGLYMVRCRAIPVLEGDEAVVRLPSVAYMIVNMMDPVDLAVAQHTRTMETREDARERIDEINRQLNGSMSLADANSLEQELLILMDIAGNLDQIFSGRIERINSQLNPLLREQESLERQLAAARAQDTPNRRTIDRLEAEIYIFQLRYSRVIRGLEAQLEEVHEIMEAREDQHSDFAGPREQIDATFVNDSGATIELVMEATLLSTNVIEGESQEEPNYRFIVADLTTNTGDIGEGEGPSRYIALSNAVVSVLEDHGDYGRGNLVLTIDGNHFHRTVQAGTGAIFREALESVTMVASIAAIIASPFTGGASLYLLLPLGVAGALPSLYRLYERYNASTLRPDMEVALDIVNAVGGFVGLSQGVASGLRLVRIGQVLLVTGFVADSGGYILMGGQMMDQLARLQSLPEGEARAQFLEIMFNGLVQAGMVAGGSLAEFQAQQHAHQRRTEARRAARREAAASEVIQGPAAHPLEAEGRATRESATPDSRRSGESAGPDTRRSTSTPDESTPQGGNNPEVVPPRAPEGHPEGSIPTHPGDDIHTPGDQQFQELELSGGDVVMPPERLDASIEEAIRYRQDAEQMYENMWRGAAENAADQSRARQKEVAMFQNSETGQIILVQGDGRSAYVLEPDGQGDMRQAYPGEGRTVQGWMEILDAQNTGHWELISHSHPVDPATGTVAARDRFPSGANGDFSGVIHTALREGVPISSRIDFITPDGPSHTTFGVTPGAERPIWIEFPDPITGERRRMDFLSMDSYHSWYEDHFGGNMGPVPDHFQSLQHPQDSRSPQRPDTESRRTPTRETQAPAIPRTPGDDGRTPHPDGETSSRVDTPSQEVQGPRSEQNPAEPMTPESIAARISENVPELIDPGNSGAHQQLLHDVGSWRELMTHLQEAVTDHATSIIENLQGLRERVVNTLGEQFGASTADSASTRPESDVDLATTGTEAGENLLAAEAYMQETYGDGWSDMFRMNFYTEARRLGLYTEIVPLLNPERFARLQRHISALTERFNLAKMLMHAGDNPESLARVEGFIEGHPDIAEIREAASMSPAQRERRRQDLHLTIDRLMAQYNETPPANTEQRIRLAEEISELQIEANFLTEEAYIGPGAARMVVDGVAVTGHEALQAALSNLEMIEHVIHQAGGDPITAAREYELYKYMYRFSEAVRDQQLDLFNDHLSRQIYQIHRDGAQGMSPGQLRAIFNHFMSFATEAIPRLRQEATARSEQWTPPTTSSEPGSTAPPPTAEGGSEFTRVPDIPVAEDSTAPDSSSSIEQIENSSPTEQLLPPAGREGETDQTPDRSSSSRVPDIEQPDVQRAQQTIDEGANLRNLLLSVTGEDRRAALTLARLLTEKLSAIQYDPNRATEDTIANIRDDIEITRSVFPDLEMQ